ncbi:hypothetical protein CHLNCDRAFT_51197 [Chlorella variabilis]|uniref:Uncharacterized protein n=1 Tax=Chlorella variabilis TaxID=554065 RepID=E1ZAY2_CHLVA|nr:hypothetical protein CHLNCDRAFT_51197 [Chlorella variabilis]EFN57131.1 hypothetical protein CHLNCDRAFT_51197 [Chlorella variabilis]|eukprot:XP_005849233.1 hypothetical protein CHLNCDRAFT_51197 [Chlorella variabilis]
MEPALDGSDGAGAPELMEGLYASESTLHSSVAFLRNTLAGLGFCQDLNLLSTEPSDVVSTCNTIYGLLLQHQKDCKFREQLKQDMHRLRLDMGVADKERGRLEARLAAKEREIGGLTNKAKAAGEQHREELKAAKKEAEDLQKKASGRGWVTGCERRIVQMQHEIKRKEKEYERLQERLAHYLADKKRSEKAALDMAGKLTQQLQARLGWCGVWGWGWRADQAGARGGRGGAAAALRSDEGLKAVVAAYEAKQVELGKENRDLKAALASLQAEYKDVLNRQVRRQQEDASTSVAAAAADDAFLQSVPSMSEEELRAELAARSKKLQRRTSNLASLSASEADFATPGEQRLFRDLQTTQSVIHDQERLLTAVLASLRSSQQAKESLHQADMRRMAQHYQAQLAAAESEIQRAKAQQAEAAQGEVDALREQLLEVKGVLQQRAEAELAAARAEAEAAAAELRAQLAEAQAAEQAAGARAAAAAAAAEREAAERRRVEEDRGGERAGLAAQQEAAVVAQQRFELVKKHYEALLRQYAPGIGAGIFLERAISRKASEMADLEMQDSAAAREGTIPAALSQR